MEEKKIKIEIKNRFTGEILFAYEKVGNTIKDIVINAVGNGADLRGANLCDANLRGANLRGADLRGAKYVPYIPIACPTDGAFTGWKKVIANDLQYLIKLFIPEDARRYSATGRKCRCDKAVVQEIRIIVDDKVREDVVEKKVINDAYGHETVYEVGKDVLPDSWDDDRFNECSHGIHFFIDKQEAIDY